ncbi:MAG TPA: hypothetical protein VFT98_07185 [Myxococcota bacterium]|nr:hypothetical protein [Myxococcota bacterium]
MGLLTRGSRVATFALGALALALAFASPARALETDQFYAWLRPLADSSDALNAKINFELDAALAEINAVNGGRNASCRDALEAIHDRYTLFIFQKIELWAQRTSVLNRIPATQEEELEYRRNWIYGGVAWYDLGRTVPPSPTIEVDGVRFGTDKISHFFSEGHYYLDWYDGARARGLSHDEAVEFATRRGIAIETTVLGGVISGVISPADLEANYQGLRWYIDLCDGETPLLERTDAGWTMREPFDLRPYVSPEWDESYLPNVVLEGRWKHVKPAILSHCAELDAPEVRERRAAYAERDQYTYTERILDTMVAAGELQDPRDYGIERLCAAAAMQAVRTDPEKGSSPQ